jgi:hypothetical protein
MKLLITLLCTLITLCTMDTASAQVASDYYFPLRIGSVRTYRASSLSWPARTVRETVNGSDLIAGKQYFRVKGIEIMDSNPADSSIFHVWWVRQDSAGNILLAAFSDRYAVLDSATQFDPPAAFFPNEFLTVGYSQEVYLAGGGYYFQDSVMSKTETVVTPAGTFTNCLKKRERNRTALGVATLIEYVYYAQTIGEVRRIREIPINEVHQQDLTQYNILTSAAGMATPGIPASIALEQNYPNPFNPSTTIRYGLVEQGHVLLTVFNALGQQVAVLENGERGAGFHEVRFDASHLSSGLYLYRLQAGSIAITRKLLLMR